MMIKKRFNVIWTAIFLQMLTGYTLLAAPKAGTNDGAGGFYTSGGAKVLDHVIRELDYTLDPKYNQENGYQACVNKILKMRNIAPIDFSVMKNIIDNNIRRLPEVSRSRKNSKGKKQQLILDFKVSKNGTKYVDILKPFFDTYKNYGRGEDTPEIQEVEFLLLHETAHHFGILDDDQAEIVAQAIHYVVRNQNTTVMECRHENDGSSVFYATTVD